ncbi:sugar phosphate isomerase/epimerase family protein [Spirosoma daeguense]
MNKILFLFCLVVLTTTGFGQQVRPIDNPFFSLHNGIRGDSVYDTFDEQVALIKELGYDGVEINQIDSFAGMKAALDKHTFTGSYFYVRLDLDSPIDPRLIDCLQALRGSKTIVSPFIISERKTYVPSDTAGNTVAVRLLRQLADLAVQNKLEVALYPHYNFWLERADHALQLAQQVNRTNLGVAFNLCHWLATTNQAERADWKAQLKNLRPVLKMITVCGANDVPLAEAGKNPWEHYILPLGMGNFDTYKLIRYAVRDLKFTGPIGVQFYGMQGDKPTNLRNTMAIWKQYRRRLSNRP